MTKPAFDLGVYPDSLNFPDTSVGESSVAQTILLTNTGYDDLEIFDIRTVGDFSTATPFPLLIGPGEYAAIYVTFSPLAAGSLSGGVYINTGDAAGEEFIELSGSGVASIAPSSELVTTIITATNVENWSPNFLRATTDAPVPAADGAVLIQVKIMATNTASPVQISFNADPALTIKNGDGDDIAIGGLVENTVVIGYRLNNTFRLLLDQQSAAIFARVHDVITILDDVSTYRDEAQAAQTAAAASAAKLIGTSESSLAISVASKEFTTQADKFFEAGTFLLITSDADEANYMHGVVTSYVGSTLTVDVQRVGGSGTFADWTIRVSGAAGVKGDMGDATTPASETVAGIVELATQAEGETGTDTTRVPPVAVVAAMIDAGLNTIDTTIADNSIAAVKLSDVALKSVGGLTPAADRLPYYTGEDAAALTPITAAGRALIDDADSAAQRTTLGLGTAAVLNVGENDGNLVQLDAVGLPAIDGSQLTGISAGSIVLLNSGTISNAANLNIGLTSFVGYRKFVLELVNWRCASDAYLQLLTSPNGGSSYDTGSTNYRYHIENGETSTGAASIVMMNVSNNGRQGNESFIGANYTIEFAGLENTALYSQFKFHGTYVSADGTSAHTFEHMVGGGVRWSTAIVDAIRLLYNTGNISSGSWALYGYL